MDLFKKLPESIRELFSSNNDEIIFFIIVFILSVFNSSRDDRSAYTEGSGPNKVLLLIIISFLFLFIANESRNDEITLIHEPVETLGIKETGDRVLEDNMLNNKPLDNCAT